MCNYWLLDQGYSYNSGFIGLAPAGPPDSFRGIECNFTDFGLDNGAPLGAGKTETFGFDFDTDFKICGDYNGGFHVGTVITVTLQDNTVFQAELLPDLENPNRAFIAW